ncbi:MAG: helix-turn-helix domain-containing protein [Candidatus Zixiibacteriota bacterium]
MSPLEIPSGDNIANRSTLSSPKMRAPMRIVRGKYYTVAQVAAFFGKSVQTIYAWINAGAIRATKVPGRKTYISGDEIHNRFSGPLPEIPHETTNPTPEEISRMNVIRRNRKKVLLQLPAVKDVTFEDILRKSREIRSAEKQERSESR